MKDRRVTFNLNPIVKEFYRDDIVYPTESDNLVYIYIFGALFVSYMLYNNKLK